MDTQPVGVLNQDGVEVISLVLSQAAWVVQGFVPDYRWILGNLGTTYDATWKKRCASYRSYSINNSMLSVKGQVLYPDDDVLKFDSCIASIVYMILKLIYVYLFLFWLDSSSEEKE